MKGKLLFTLIVIWTLVFSACSTSESDALPTLVPTIAFPTQTPAPTNTPAPTATFETSNNAEALVRRVAGSMMLNQSLRIERYTSYKEETFPDGRVGYDIDFSFNSPENYSREEILQLAYSLMHEFYYNFSEANVMYTSLLIFGEQVDANCNLGLGIGYVTATNFLPEKNPEDLNAWFSFFVDEQYFGDLPGESQALLAYGNDPASIRHLDTPLNDASCRNLGGQPFCNGSKGIRLPLNIARLDIVSTNAALSFITRPG